MPKQNKLICSGRLIKNKLIRCANSKCIHGKLHHEYGECTKMNYNCPWAIVQVHCIVPTKKQKIELMVDNL